MDALIRASNFLSDQDPDLNGGITRFPLLGKGVKANKGDVLLWASCARDGELEDLSLHQGEPVKRGEKVILNLFIPRSQISRAHCASLDVRVPETIAYLL